jgi:acetylglutamate kinase
VTAPTVGPGGSPAALKASVLAEALPWLRRWRGSTVVIKHGGAALEAGGGPAGLAGFAADVVLLASVGLRPVVVHGGGPQIGAWMRRVGKDPVFVDGMRVTDAETLDIARMVLVGKVNRELVAALNVHGPVAVGISGEDAGLIRASAHPGGLGFVGEVEAVDPTILTRLLAEGIVPVVATIGADATGQAYNINADVVAGALAGALGAAKLVFLTDVEGIRTDPADPATLRRQLGAAELEALLEGGSLVGGMRPKATASLAALTSGVGSVHLVDGRIPHALLVEIFTDEGIGTMVRATGTVPTGLGAGPGAGVEAVGGSAVADRAAGGEPGTAARAGEVLMPTYAPPQVRFVSGRGAWLVDDAGRPYLDLLSGIAVTSLGHCHPALVSGLRDQAERLWHVSNLFETEPGPALAARLDRLVGGGVPAGGRVFFANSGAEANECALKLARRRGGPARSRILSALGGFHGRTFGALAATGQPEKAAAFAPLPGGFEHLPYGDLAAWEVAIDETVAAVVVESIQGEAGVVVPPDGWLTGLRRRCDETGALLVVDEVQTGLGRTGRWWGFEHEAVLPDVVTMAKALGNGMPIGACWARAEVAAAFRPGDHGSTFGGQPLAAATALAVLDALEALDAPERAEHLGRELATALAALPGVAAVRGRGLLLGVVLDPSCGSAAEVARRCLEAGLVVNAPAAQVLRLAPPLVVEPDELEQAVAVLAAVLEGGPPPLLRPPSGLPGVSERLLAPAGEVA